MVVAPVELAGVAQREAQRREGLDRRADAPALIGLAPRVAPHGVVAAIIPFAAQQVGDPCQGQLPIAAARRDDLRLILSCLFGQQMGEKRKQLHTLGLI